ncbi:protein EMSY-LIKE 3-like isoform X2 [Diospyros lotus]|uniref:protein EMSY-LIKE 3-like isoform X2 n=1 Tax=Diospyros lotus TaxID=55363 RepID=UPI00225AB45A|nr:protein EMSY-LIKE 3-like isoform X2 [Diospyros lotus]
MECGLSDSSGTDDDLPARHQNRFPRAGHAAGNGGSAVVITAQLSRMNNDMETQIHHIEQEAYSSVLRAFKAQSDAISWDKEGLITELRKELRVSDEEHRELLSRVNADDIIRRIREWRKARGLQPVMLSSSQPIHDPMPSPSVSASLKKQKTSQSVGSLSRGAPSPPLHPTMQPSAAALKRGPVSRSRGKKTKSHTSAGLTGRAKVANQGSSGPLGVQPSEAANFNPLIGRKVWTRWPEDNNFYEAVIVDYNSGDGRHALVYDIRTADETWEWVNLKEISAEDIQWEDPGISHRGGRSGPNRGFKKPMAHIGAAARGRGTTKHQPSKDLPSSQKKALGDIEILNTDTLIKEVEKVFSANQPDPKEVEKAKKVLKEHEQALVDAIATLEDASDDGERQLMEQDDQCRNQNYHSVIGEGGPDGNKREIKDGKAGSQAQEQQPQESTALKQ